MRLVGGINDLQGRVEVYYKGIWGTVCDDGWGISDGDVVCRMLGYGPASATPGSAYFGQGTGKILFTNVGCSGMESDLAQCHHSGSWKHNCAHNEDAGVICKGFCWNFHSILFLIFNIASGLFCQYY